MSTQITSASSSKGSFPFSGPLGKSYEPREFEPQIYQFWEESGFFSAADNNEAGQDAFCMVIPPPNVTGVLHMGHALTNTIQDILVRWRRMKGDNTLWLPGTDHAGIATQAQVEKAIAKEGKGPAGKPLTRHDIGRKAFLERTWKWKDDHGREIVSQLRRLGSSLDWKRERFTMDPGLSVAVREVFVRLYEEGLIYRGERIINWCPRCQTALSDLEVVPTERKGYFWHIAYKLVDENNAPLMAEDGTQQRLIIATTRPETLLGDTAVAVHPDDERYKGLHGKKAVLPLLNRLIPVITDVAVDREFGSGALKITPAHDFNDNEIAKRHGLSLVSVMGKDGRISPAGGTFAGLKFDEARERVLQELKESGLLIKTEDHVHKVGLCQRCEHVAEPIISKQWFVKIEPLAKPAIKAVEDGKITFSPKSWEKTYFEWMYNIRDWCISRQLWWGHQIPAWYCGRCQEITVSRTEPSRCSHCNAPVSELQQDEDVLDTWFSSALWPFSTLGWPESTDALKTFYPTAILETGFDIIFFWVARMIMMGIHFMDDVPFRRVYLHAMVRDEKGEKMSKSKGNVEDPLEWIREQGADPLRFTLAVMAGQGRDVKLAKNRVEGYHAFCNKIWNATKYFHLQLESFNGAEGGSGEKFEIPAGGVGAWLLEHRDELQAPNRWILAKLQHLIVSVEKGLEGFELNDSAQAIYEYSWHELCDWYIEFSKLLFKKENHRRETFFTLYHALESLFRLAHPFMPFLTEILWQSLPGVKPAFGAETSGSVTLMLQHWPGADPRFASQDAEKTIELLKAIIESIRNFRGENGISPKVEFEIRYWAEAERVGALLVSHKDELEAMARIKLKEIPETAPEILPETAPEILKDQSNKVALISIKELGIKLFIALEGLVNREEELKRLQKELDRVRSDLAHVRKKLSQDTFLAKAPPALVEQEKTKEQNLATKLAELERNFSRSGN